MALQALLHGESAEESIAQYLSLGVAGQADTVATLTPGWSSMKSLAVRSAYRASA